MRILITGADGQLGRALSQKIGPRAISLTRQNLDITDRNAVLMRFSEARPDIVINTAAFTNVDAAEKEPAKCQLVNVQGVSNLIEACTALDCTFVQISTAYVFHGSSTRSKPFLETEATNPKGVYARSKWASEEIAREYDKSFVVRTCGLYASAADKDFENFPNSILRRAASQPEVAVVCDQICIPSYVPHVADGVLSLALSDDFGTYHIANNGAVSWHQFATHLLRLVGANVPIKRITSKEAGALAPRPAFSVLDTLKYESLGFKPLPHWREALQEFVNSKRSQTANLLSNR